jgi:hypothetical protein
MAGHRQKKHGVDRQRMANLSTFVLLLLDLETVGPTEIITSSINHIGLKALRSPRINEFLRGGWAS